LQNLKCTSALGEAFYGTSYFSKKFSLGYKLILLASHFQIASIGGGYYTWTAERASMESSS
jgi:hypothetical protein